MNRILFILAMALFGYISAAQEPPAVASKPADTPEQIVQRQLDAYNRRDLDAFAATYAADVKLHMHPDTVRTSGMAELRKDYGLFFAENPKLHATITKRIVQGNFVIDQEHVTGIEGGGEIRAVAIYYIRDGKIQNVWFIR